MENTPIIADIVKELDVDNKIFYRNKTLLLDEVIKMRYLLADKINDYADKEESLFSTSTETIFYDMVSFYQSGQYVNLKPIDKHKSGI